DDPLPVLRLERAAGPARVLQAAALADDALPAVERGREFHDAKGRLVERRIDPLPLAGRVAVAERGHHAEGREEPGHVVGIDGRGARGRPVGRPVHVPRAAERRADRGVAGPLVERAGLAEGGYPRHPPARIYWGER